MAVSMRYGLFFYNHDTIIYIMGDRRMNIAVLDDQSDFLPHVKELLMQSLNLQQTIIDTYLIKNTESFPKQVYDMYIIDIEMPINGFQYAEKLNSKAKIVFISVHEHLVYSSFSFNPYFFIRKKNLQEDIQKLAEKIKRQSDFYLLNQNGEKFPVMTHDILLLESEENYVNFVLTNKQTYLQRTTLKKLEECPQFVNFVCVCRGLLINIEHILELKNSKIITDDGCTYDISKVRKKETLNKINEWRLEHYVK